MSVKEIYDSSRKKFVPFWRRTRLRSAIYAVLVFPLYLLSKVIPKADHYVYGSFSGRMIGDNSLYSFRAAQRDGSARYFISKSPEAIADSTLGDRAIYAYSARGIWLQLRAARAYFSHTIDDFFAPTVMGSNVIALGHGVPMKKSAAADAKLSWIQNAIFRRAFLSLTPFLYHYYCNEVHSPSHFFDEYKLEVYGYTKPKLVRAPMARTAAPASSSSNQGRILFAPTFRKYQSFADTLKNAGLFTAELQQVLQQQNVELWIKPHYLDEAEMGEITLPSGVRWLIAPSINEKFGDFSALITDYSSVFYDASFAGLAVGFVTHDIDSYVENDTELYDWFRKLAESAGSKNLASAIDQLQRDGGVKLERFFEAG